MIAMPYPYQTYPNYYPAPVPDQLAQLRQYQQPQGNPGIIWVGSELEAANYLMAPNSAVALWNSNAPCIYLKQTDASGRPTMKTFDLVERTTAAPQGAQTTGGEFVARKEFDALVARVDEMAGKSKGADE